MAVDAGPLGFPVLDAFDVDAPAPLPPPWGGLGVLDYIPVPLKVAGATAVSSGAAWGGQQYELPIPADVVPVSAKTEVWVKLGGGPAGVNLMLAVPPGSPPASKAGGYYMRFDPPNRVRAFVLGGAVLFDVVAGWTASKPGAPRPSQLAAYAAGCSVALTREGVDVVAYVRDTPATAWREVGRATDSTFTGPGWLGLDLAGGVAGLGASAFGGGVEAGYVPPAPPTVVTVPAIVGVPKVGEILTAVAGVWEGDDPIAVVADWIDAATDATIASASAPLELLPAHEGMTLFVGETASNDAGEDVAASAPVGPIAPADVVPPIEPPASTSLAVRARAGLVAELAACGIDASDDAGTFYPQPIGVLVGLPTLDARGLANRTYTVPVLVVVGDALSDKRVVDRLYELTDDVAIALSTFNYKPSNWRSSGNAEPLPALELSVTVTVSEEV